VASWRQGVVAVSLLLVCACAPAAVRLTAASLALPGIEFDNLRAEATLGADGRPQWQVQAGKVTLPSLGWKGVALDLRGEAQRGASSVWKLTGHVEAWDAPGGALGNANLTVVYDPDEGTLEVDVQQGNSTLHARMPLDQTSHVQMTLTGLPLAWLDGMLASAWPDGHVTSGTIAGDVALDLAKDDTRASGRIDIAGADVDSRTGNVAAQKLDAAGSFLIETGPAAPNVMFDGRLDGGQILLGPLFAQLPPHPAYLHISAGPDHGGFAVDALDFDDHDALRVAGSLGFDRKGNLDKVAFSRFAATLPAAYTRYGTTLIQNFTGLQNLSTSGSIVGSLTLDAGEPRAFDLDASDVSVNGGGIAVAGLNGKLDWQANASRPETKLGWDALGFYRLAFGPARLDLADEAGALTLRAPASAGLFGGTFRLGRFAWRPDADKAQRVAAAFSVSGVDMTRLCKAFGWPAFGGTLGGAVPDMQYRGDSLAFAGGLSLNVFDGSVSVTDLGLQHPFGDAPALTADIDMSQLDLAQLTGAFDFGQITGRMDGDIHGLQLVNWKPVAFRAALHADGGGKISQHAIKSLTEVGGGGISGGLQSMALRLFKTFDYARIDLSCTLAGGVCAMGGVTPDPDSEDNGYTIVEGSGLPRVTVIGHERAVDWATLVGRLEAATRGDGPVVR
jgi:hypothetical protein